MDSNKKLVLKIKRVRLSTSVRAGQLCGGGIKPPIVNPPPAPNGGQLAGPTQAAPSDDLSVSSTPTCGR